LVACCTARWKNRCSNLHNAEQSQQKQQAYNMRILLPAGGRIDPFHAYMIDE
jgi:hypothetical protein